MNSFDLLQSIYQPLFLVSHLDSTLLVRQHWCVHVWESILVSPAGWFSRWEVSGHTTSRICLKQHEVSLHSSHIAFSPIVPLQSYGRISTAWKYSISSYQKDSISIGSIISIGTIIFQQQSMLYLCVFWHCFL